MKRISLKRYLTTTVCCSVPKRKRLNARIYKQRTKEGVPNMQSSTAECHLKVISLKHLPEIYYLMYNLNLLPDSYLLIALLCWKVLNSQVESLGCFIDRTKEIRTWWISMATVTKCPEIPFQINSLPSCLLYLDKTLVCSSLGAIDSYANDSSVNVGWIKEKIWMFLRARKSQILKKNCMTFRPCFTLLFRNY